MNGITVSANTNDTDINTRTSKNFIIANVNLSTPEEVQRHHLTCHIEIPYFLQTSETFINK